MSCGARGHHLRNLSFDMFAIMGGAKIRAMSNNMFSSHFCEFDRPDAWSVRDVPNSYCMMDNLPLPEIRCTPRSTSMSILSTRHSTRFLIPGRLAANEVRFRWITAFSDTRFFPFPQPLWSFKWSERRVVWCVANGVQEWALAFQRTPGTCTLLEHRRSLPKTSRKRWSLVLRESEDDARHQFYGGWRLPTGGLLVIVLTKILICESVTHW